MRSVCPFGLYMKVFDFCRRYYARNIYVYIDNRPAKVSPLDMNDFLDRYGEFYIKYFQVVSKYSVLVDLEGAVND